MEQLDPHINTRGQLHGLPNAPVHHDGDLGNIVTVDGKGNISTSSNSFSLWPNAANSVIGRAIVIHAMPDDGGVGLHADSLTTGHAGMPVLCGTIGIAKPAPLLADLAPKKTINGCRCLARWVWQGRLRMGASPNAPVLDQKGHAFCFISPMSCDVSAHRFVVGASQSDPADFVAL